MAAVVIVFVVRLAKVNEVVRLTSRGLDQQSQEPTTRTGTFAKATYRFTRWLDPILLNEPAVEKRLADQVFENEADLNDAPSLRAYEARAFRLRRIAQRARQTGAGMSAADRDDTKAALLEER